MAESDHRKAALVLTLPDGTILGHLPALPVLTPWWQETEQVVAAFRARHGIDVTILRLLEAERAVPHGGCVTYLAEVERPVPAGPWHGAIDDDPRRLPYARPGGPKADLAWAEAALARQGLERNGPPVQVRSWNLSSLWRIPLVGSTAWLKVIPPFLAPEGLLLEQLAGACVPRLLARDGHRILLAEIPGADLYEAETPRLRDMVTPLVDLQQTWAGRADRLLGLGLPDWRGAALSVAISEVFERTADALSGTDRAILRRFVDDLPRRFAALAACGLPDTLIHGDFHPGNFRGDGRSLVLLDWGDSGVGHPLLDQPAFLTRIPEGSVAPVQAHWVAAWRGKIPGCDPVQAARLIAPIAAARQAAIYRRFLDAIEPSEYPYHQSDPADWLRRTATLQRA